MPVGLTAQGTQTGGPKSTKKRYDYRQAAANTGLVTRSFANFVFFFCIWVFSWIVLFLSTVYFHRFILFWFEKILIATLSGSFIDSVDLQNAVYEQEGLDILEKMEKEGMAFLLEDQDINMTTGTTTKNKTANVDDNYEDHDLGNMTEYNNLFK